jgi:hypothetical protein
MPDHLYADGDDEDRDMSSLTTAVNALMLTNTGNALVTHRISISTSSTQSYNYNLNINNITGHLYFVNNPPLTADEYPLLLKCGDHVIFNHDATHTWTLWTYANLDDCADVALYLAVHEATGSRIALMLPMIWSYEANVDEEDSDDSSEE